MKSDSQRYHIGCKKKKTQQIVPALLTAYGGVDMTPHVKKFVTIPTQCAKSIQSSQESELTP